MTIALIGSSGKMGGFYVKALDRLGLEWTGYDIKDGPLDLGWIANEFDRAIIATPTAYHRDHIMQFVVRSKPVLVEKPVTMTLAEAESLREFGHLISVGYGNRFIPAFQQARELVKGQVSIYRAGPRPATDYGGVAIDLASHDIDLLLSLGIGGIFPVEITPDFAYYEIRGRDVQGSIVARYLDHSSQDRIRRWEIADGTLVLDMTEQSLRHWDGSIICYEPVNQVERELASWVASLDGFVPTIRVAGFWDGRHALKGSLG